MQRTRWMDRAGPAAALIFAVLAGCGDRAEQAAPPAAGPTVAQEQARTPTAPGLKVATLHVKGMH